MSEKSIIFYFPYMHVGGVSVLFLRMANALKEHCKVYLVDFADGYMGRRVPPGVHFIDFKRVERYPDNAVLVVQSLAPWNIADIGKFPPQTRVFFWNLHPDNFFPHIFSGYTSNRLKRLLAGMLRPMSLLRTNKLLRVLRYLDSTKSLAFMDAENYRKTQAYFPGLELAERYLPVMSNQAGASAEHRIQRPLRCCWVGRVVDFKVFILAHLLTRLDAAQSVAGDIEFTVVGDGNALPGLKAQAAQLPKLKIRYIEEIALDALPAFLAAEVDLLFAMGTSALEGASIGLPTILVDYSYYPITRNYRFKWLYQSEGFSLGGPIDDRHYEMDSSLESTLLDLQGGFEKHGQKCYSYWLQNHSPAVVESRLLELTNDSSATVADMEARGFFKPDPCSFVLRRLRSLVRRDEVVVHGFRNI